MTGAYSRELGLFDVWHFVGGSPEVVHVVWSSYGIGVSVDRGTEAAAADHEGATTSGAGDSEAPAKGLSKSDLALAGTIIQKFGGGYEVGHSAPFWIVDKKGVVRVGMDAGATPADLATNIRALLKLD